MLPGLALKVDGMLPDFPFVGPMLHKDSDEYCSANTADERAAAASVLINASTPFCSATEHPTPDGDLPAER